MNNIEPDSGAASQSVSQCSSFEVDIFSWSGWEDYWVWGQVRLFYSQVSGQAKLFTTILRNCQEFWSDITERILNNHSRGMKKSGLECAGEERRAGAGGDKFYRVQETQVANRRICKMKGPVGCKDER